MRTSRYARAAAVFAALHLFAQTANAQTALNATLELGSPTQFEVNARYQDPSELFERLRGSRIIPIWITVKNASSTPAALNFHDITLGLGDPRGTIQLQPIDRGDVPAEFQKAADLGPVLGMLARQGGDWGANPFARQLGSGTLKPAESRSGFVFFLRPEGLSFTGVMTIGTTAHPPEMVTTASMDVTNSRGIAGTISKTVGRIINGPPPFGKTYAVLFGIWDYTNRKGLPYVARDLDKMEAYLRQQGFDKVVKVTNKGVTVDTLRNIQAQLKVTLTREDRLLVYYAGHGARVDNRGYIVLATSQGLKLNPKTEVEMKEFISWMLGQPVKHLLVILDACYSGSAVGGSDVDWGTRETEPLFANVDQDTLFRLSNGEGKFVMMAGAEDQLAHEGPDWQGGLFTYAILSGLKNKGASTSTDPIITTYDVFTRAKAIVLQEVKRRHLGEQNPLVRDMNRPVSKGEFVFVRPN